jgi:hypothetical protein
MTVSRRSKYPKLTFDICSYIFECTDKLKDDLRKIRQQFRNYVKKKILMNAKRFCLALSYNKRHTEISSKVSFMCFPRCDSSDVWERVDDATVIILCLLMLRRVATFACHNAEFIIETMA